MKEEVLEVNNNRKEEITLIVQTLYYANDFLREEPLELLVKKALDRYLYSNLSISEIRKKLLEEVNDRLAAYNNRYNKDKVKTNHEFIYSMLKQLAKKLEENGVDYYIAGGLCGYIKYGEESSRCHDDIDININEKDLGKLKKICKEMGLDFKDNRLNSTKVLDNGNLVGDHEVIATTDNFHIGAFPFERLVDGTVISKGYYKDANGKASCREEIFGSNLANEILNEKPITFDGQPVYITEPEYLYILKSMSDRSKDKYDAEFLEDKVNMDKVKEIRELIKTEHAIQFASCDDVKEIVEDKKDNSELNDMFKEEKEVINKKTEEKIDKPKQFVKTDNNDSKRGAASISSILLVVLIAVFFVLIGLITYYTLIK